MDFLPSLYYRNAPHTHQSGKEHRIFHRFSGRAIDLINSFAVGLSTSVVLPFIGLSGELRDNRLRSKRLGSPEASSPQEKNPSGYDQFRSEIKGFMHQQKQALRKRLEAKRQEPRLKKQQEEFQY